MLCKQNNNMKCSKQMFILLTNLGKKIGLMWNHVPHQHLMSDLQIFQHKTLTFKSPFPLLLNKSYTCIFPHTNAGETKSFCSSLFSKSSENETDLYMQMHLLINSFYIPRLLTSIMSKFSAET
ncbi:hypothetical protein CHS0354_005380 [Potamilus streckersoni]|uniref:Uncharacterized protein n=1 Tax=Potamilus streckersoni TaxID=2493646 RepID=A0AAE0SKF2_9BIVA|nr:hypothetical protein CHS0354_005380 [Potamilus streckersoni]